MSAILLFVLPLLLAGSTAAAQPAGQACPPSGMTRPGLLQLKDSQFAVPNAEERNRLALSLLSCLDDPDPRIRDGVVFEGLSTWLRGKALLPATILTLEESLHKTLEGPADKAGFRLPFAALVMSEVARTDRIEPLFPDAVRERLVELAAASLSRVSDYRGFDGIEGWRHGVAHGADLVLQLALNPKVAVSGLRRMMGAAAAQVAPKGAVFYTFGEPERLARAVLFTYRRGLLDAAFWQGWIQGIADSKPLPDWRTAFQSVDGLAKRHNTLAFLHALSFAARSSNDEASKTLAAMADKAAAQVGS